MNNNRFTFIERCHDIILSSFAFDPRRIKDYYIKKKLSYYTLIIDKVTIIHRN